MGMLNASILSRVVTRFVGRPAVRRYKVRFATRAWPGDHVICTARSRGSSTRRARSGSRASSPRSTRRARRSSPAPSWPRCRPGRLDGPASAHRQCRAVGMAGPVAATHSARLISEPQRIRPMPSGGTVGARRLRICEAHWRPRSRRGCRGPEAPGAVDPLLRVVDPHSRPRRHRRPRDRARSRLDPRPLAQQVRAVQPPVDAEGRAQLARPARERVVGARRAGAGASARRPRGARARGTRTACGTSAALVTTLNWWYMPYTKYT